jgi:hypothetical protein
MPKPKRQDQQQEGAAVKAPLGTSGGRPAWLKISLFVAIVCDSSLDNKKSNSGHHPMQAFVVAVIGVGVFNYAQKNKKWTPRLRNNIIMNLLN